MGSGTPINTPQHSLKYVRALLRIVGVWPLIEGFRNKFEKYLSIAQITICSVLTLFAVIPMMHDTMIGMNGIKNKDKIKILGPLCYAICCTIKYFYLNLRSPNLKACLRQMERDWKFIDTTKHQDLMLEYVFLAQKVTLVLTSCHYVLDLSYCTVLPIWTNSLKIAGNDTAKALIYAGVEYFVESPYTTPNYELIYTAQWIYGFISVTTEAALCGIVTTMVAHACGMFRIQMRLLRELVPSEQKKGESKELLAMIVASHVDALKYSKDISIALQELCFMEVVGSTTVICALEYLCIVEWDNQDIIATGAYFGIIISLSLNILVICYVGERLVEEFCLVKLWMTKLWLTKRSVILLCVQIRASIEEIKESTQRELLSLYLPKIEAERIGEVTYDVPWYNLPKRKSMNLVLLIAVSKFPPKLTGGKIFKISLSSFSTILKSTVVYMQLCRSIMEW